MSVSPDPADGMRNPAYDGPMGIFADFSDDEEEFVSPGPAGLNLYSPPMLDYQRHYPKAFLHLLFPIIVIGLCHIALVYSWYVHPTRWVWMLWSQWGMVVVAWAFVLATARKRAMHLARMEYNARSRAVRQEWNREIG